MFGRDDVYVRRAWPPDHGDLRQRHDDHLCVRRGGQSHVGRRARPAADHGRFRHAADRQREQYVRPAARREGRRRHRCRHRRRDGRVHAAGRRRQRELHGPGVDRRQWVHADPLHGERGRRHLPGRCSGVGHRHAGSLHAGQCPGATGTATVLGVSANPAVFATAVTLTATITGIAPTGTVNFMVGGVSIPGCSARPVSSGQATCVISTLALGNNSLTALYSGDGMNGPGTSLLLVLEINAPATLPDTGQEACYDDTDNGADFVPASDPASIARDAGTFPRQDCRYGRDAAAAAGALTKIGAGARGRDYTKIANSGATLIAGAALGTAQNEWACTKDNTTGLTWEVKTDTPATLRYRFHTYTWRDTDGTANGGDPGSVGTDTCSATLPSGQCNTQAFVAAVNAQQLCGHSDWRLPSHRELLTLVYLDGSAPTIAPDYFPNTLADPFWSSTTNARFPENAWQVDFLSHYIYNGKTQAVRVRLVRGEPF
ncbi:MAG: DUF1566 domain-containing protein [Betaproteobacteria bacterium]|nr:DUF1566 domain-containing protein [Betaproteobacteria bacterium]